MKKKTELIFALDTPKKKNFQYLLDSTKDLISFYKVGLIPFISLGKESIFMIKRRKRKVFLDLKIFDIPNTMIKASLNAIKWNVDIIDYHLFSDKNSLNYTLEQIRKELKKRKKDPPLMLGVTILTSQTNRHTIPNSVLSLAQKAKEIGFDGVIASGREAKEIRNKLGSKFIIASPGIRLKVNNRDDQKRIVQPKNVKGIVDFVIVGRPIYEADNPQEVIRYILRQLR